jgi:uncharacterized delta-60 repeat protein
LSFRRLFLSTKFIDLSFIPKLVDYLKTNSTMGRIFTLLAIVLTISASAQINVQWESRYNGAGGNTTEIVADMYVDPSGNVYVTGSSFVTGQGYNIVTVKYNNAGAQQWVASFNGDGSGLDEARAIHVDAAGNVYVTGYAFRSGSNYDYTTIMYNSSGGQVWQQYYDVASLFDEAHDIAVDASGNVYVTGGGKTSTSNTNFRTVKYNSAGAQQWVRDYTSAGNNLDMATLITLDASGNVYVAGHSFNTGQDLNYRVVKYDPAGTQQWTVQYNSTLNSYDTPTAMSLDASGNLFVTGYAYNGATSDDDIHTIKINTTGSVINNASFNGTANGADAPNQLIIDGSGNIYIAGKAKNTGTAEDFLVLKYNSSLAEQWNNSFNGSGSLYDEAESIAIDAAGNVYAAGYSYLSTSNNDFMTVRYNPADGQRVWTTRFNGTANNSDQGKVINVDAAGNVYISGDSKGSGTGTDYSTIKYCQLTTDAGSHIQICIGDTIQMSVTGGSSVTWSPSTGLSATNISNPDAFPSSTQTYFISSTDGNNCTDLDTVMVVVNPLPGPVITANGPTTFCAGGSVSLEASGFSAYTWSTSATTSSITVGTGGTYTVTVTDSMGCENSTSAIVTVNALPNVDAGSVSAICTGDSTQLNATGALSFTWQNSADLSSTSVADPYASPAGTMTFYVTGTDANGCMNSDSVTVNVNPLPATPNVTLIQSSHTLVTSNNTGNQWYLNGVAISGGTSQTFNVVVNGDYWVTFTDINGCTSLNSDTITVLDMAVSELEKQYNFMLYPNPNEGSFLISMQLNSGMELQFTIVDATGRMMMNETWNESGSFQKQINADQLGAGIYFVRVVIGEDVINKRMIVR